jgi:hypothetical protein
MNTSKPNPSRKNTSAVSTAATTKNPDVEMGQSRRSSLDELLDKFSSGTPPEDQEPEARESNISAVPLHL